jgi:hypothetical protein
MDGQRQNYIPLPIPSAGDKKVMIQVQVCGRQRQSHQDYNNTSIFFFLKSQAKIVLRFFYF